MEENALPSLCLSQKGNYVPLIQKVPKKFEIFPAPSARYEIFVFEKQSLILLKMLIFTGTLNLSRFRGNWHVMVSNEFHRVLNFKNSCGFSLSQSKVIDTCFCGN